MQRLSQPCHVGNYGTGRKQTLFESGVTDLEARVLKEGVDGVHVILVRSATSDAVRGGVVEHDHDFRRGPRGYREGEDNMGRCLCSETNRSPSIATGEGHRQIFV
jgi:hypothetical protein